MDVTFDFEYEGKGYFGEIYRPLAKVSFKSFKSNLWSDIWMVVDTGADFSILPKYVSRDLNISLEEDCILDRTEGVGGSQTIYLCKQRITCKLGKFIREVSIAFFDNDQVPPLLGRLGFLETFNAEFLKSHKVIFRD